jgi:hypothetical protein
LLSARGGGRMPSKLGQRVLDRQALLRYTWNTSTAAQGPAVPPTGIGGCFMVEPIFGRDTTVEERGSWDNRLIVDFVNPVTGEVREFPHQFGVGAMWRALWYPRNFTWSNEVEPHLIVATPGGSWDIDSRASNCTLPNDCSHRCWVRHGRPPIITVDKNGTTCAAGGGSIVCGGYHGFLVGGRFT